MVEIDLIDRVRRDIPPSPDGVFHVVFVGHVVPAKGLRELVSACVRLQYSPLRLDVVGPAEPMFQAKLEHLAAERDNGSWLHFHGSVDRDEAVRHIARADIFVLPSHTEGMPNVILQAMACGRPILSTTVGAVPEMLNSGTAEECGICVPPQDSNALADALLRLSRHPEYRLALGRKARQHAEQRYAMSVGCQKLLDLWRSISERTTSGRDSLPRAA